MKSWDKWKRPENGGREAMELRERYLWQSALGLKRPPQLTNLTELARNIRGHQ